MQHNKMNVFVHFSLKNEEEKNKNIKQNLLYAFFNRFTKNMYSYL